MFTDDKITHLSHVLLKGLMDRDIIILNDEEGKARREIKHSLVAFLKRSEDIDTFVRKKLQSFSRKIVENSPEWEVLYKKFYKEEAARKGLTSE